MKEKQLKVVTNELYNKVDLTQLEKPKKRQAWFGKFEWFCLGITLGYSLALWFFWWILSRIE